jgi:hypothetical protein
LPDASILEFGHETNDNDVEFTWRLLIWQL